MHFCSEFYKGCYHGNGNNNRENLNKGEGWLAPSVPLLSPLSSGEGLGVRSPKVRDGSDR
ncbi:MAG: hypothetical protein LBB79_00305 [Prevotellaceae bacterium]|nr:hypothetical protein [Prevotellaceae bacterium]